MFRRFSRLKKHHQLFFSLIILSGIVCLWRGLWGLLDLYLFADNPSLSYILSAIIGIVIVGITHYTVDRVV